MNTTIPQKQLLVIAAISITYITISLLCDLVCYRLVTFGGLIFAGSALTYPALYPLLDMLTRLIGKHSTIMLIIFFHIGDLIFSYVPYLINQLPYPASFTHYHEFNVMLSPLPRMFWSGIVSALVASIVEVILYSFMQKRMRGFLLPSFIATAIILFAHNLPVDFIAYRKAYPDIYLHLMVSNFIFGLVAIFSYAFVISRVLNVIVRRVFHDENLTMPVN